MLVLYKFYIVENILIMIIIPVNCLSLEIVDKFLKIQFQTKYLLNVLVERFGIWKGVSKVQFDGSDRLFQVLRL